VVYGLPSTVPVTLEMMAAHGAAVVRGSYHAVVVIDMPFGSYEASPEKAFESAAWLLKQTGAAAVKLEGGRAMAPTVKFLSERGIIGLSHADTAGAAAFVAESGRRDVAAIAPALAADLYGLDIIEREVEDAHDNTTRFVVLAKEARDPTALEGARAMTTFIFEVKNIPAALYKALGCFATNGVNMTKLESYQKGASFAATQFFADIEGAPGDPRVDAALEELAFQTNEVRLLGSYAQARKRG
jgi:prephenate dehydratase